MEDDREGKCREERGEWEVEEEGLYIDPVHLFNIESGGDVDLYVFCGVCRGY